MASLVVSVMSRCGPFPLVLARRGQEHTAPGRVRGRKQSFRLHLATMDGLRPQDKPQPSPKARSAGTASKARDGAELGGRGNEAQTISRTGAHWLVFGVSAGQGGLGRNIFENRNLLDIPAVFASLLTVIIIGLIVENLIFRTIERSTVQKWGIQT